jgi:hypothetical protein
MDRGTSMEGRTKTGDIDNILGGRFGGLRLDASAAGVARRDEHD